MLECGFESRLGLEFSGFNMAVRRKGFSPVKIDAISTLSNLIAKLSLPTT